MEKVPTPPEQAPPLADRIDQILEEADLSGKIKSFIESHDESKNSDCLLVDVDLAEHKAVFEIEAILERPSNKTLSVAELYFSIHQSTTPDTSIEIGSLTFVINSEEKCIQLTHRLVTTKDIGMTGSQYLQLAIRELQKLNSNDLLPDWPLHMEAGQPSVINWALKNGFTFIDKQEEEEYKMLLDTGTYQGHIVTVEPGMEANPDPYYFGWKPGAYDILQENNASASLLDSHQKHLEGGSMVSPRFLLTKQIFSGSEADSGSSH